MTVRARRRAGGGPSATERAVGRVLGALVVLGAALLPVATRWIAGDDNYWLQVVVWVLFFGYCSAAWNLIGGFAGQYSIGHAAFLGIGAYVLDSALPLRRAVAPGSACSAGGVVGAAVGGVDRLPVLPAARAPSSRWSPSRSPRCCGSGTELTDTLFGLEVNGVRGLIIPPVGQSWAAFQFVDKRYYYWIMLALLLVRARPWARW